jgi:thiol oxidase
MQQLPQLWPVDAVKDPWGEEGSEGKAATDVCTAGGKAAPVVQASGQYVACKGSKPDSRGFTCGLWLLFHTTAAR